MIPQKTDAAAALVDLAAQAACAPTPLLTVAGVSRSFYRACRNAAPA